MGDIRTGVARPPHKNSQAVVVHCRGGLGRTGIIAARLLIELGEQPNKALVLTAAARRLCGGFRHRVGLSCPEVLIRLHRESGA